MKTWGSTSTLGVELAPPRWLSSNRIKRAAGKNVRNVGDTGEGDAGRCCQQKSRSELGQKGNGSTLWIRTVIDARYMEHRVGIPKRDGFGRSRPGLQSPF